MLLSRVGHALLIASSVVPVAAQAFTDAGDGGIVVPFDESLHAFGTGMCGGDFDGDGDVDVIILGDAGSGNPNKLFLNDGDLHFIESPAANLGMPHQSKACRAADIDNDGDLDVFVANYRQPCQLFVNDGAARFTEVGALRGVAQVTSAYSATFGDFDRDGWVDLYVGSRDRAVYSDVFYSGDDDFLYRNTGEGYFVDVTSQSGIDFNGWTLTAEFIDYNDDMWPDLFVTNEKAPGTGADPTELFRNNGNGTFTRVGAQTGAAHPIEAMGFDFADAFNDGGTDFYISDLPNDHMLCIWDEAAQQFVDRTHELGVTGGWIGWATHFFDYDNDGWQDLHVVHTQAPNFLYRNPGVPASANTPWPRVRGWGSPIDRQTSVVVADFDDDGRIDLLNRMIGFPFAAPPESIILLENNMPERNWLKIETIGSMSNRDGIGARIEVTANGMTQRQWVHVGAGFLSGSDRRRHFGLGDATSADVFVHWPSGLCQSLPNVNANQILEVVEPKIELIGSPAPGNACYLHIDAHCDAGAFYAIALAFAEHPRSILPGGRPFSVRLDALSAFTLTPGNALLHGNVAQLHRGWGQALLTVPSTLPMAGITLHAGALTYDATGIRTIFPATSIQF